MPCSHGSGCPLGVDVPALANALLADDRASAFSIARAGNPFASSCGHGCHAPCETACRRRYFGAPVAVGALEAHAAGLTTPAADVPEPAGPCTSAHDVRSVAGLVGRRPRAAVGAARSGKRVAIVGAGPAGLACAHDLVLLGHSCIVFDSAREPGGLLTGALPDFRFPVASARAESAAILAMGVAFEGGYEVMGSGDLRALLSAECDAIFLAIGASEQRGPMFPGQARHPRVADAIEILRNQRALAGPTVVVGDGDLAIDAARSVVRRAVRDGLPPAQVQLVLQAPRDESPVAPSMLGAAIEEGIAVHMGWTPTRYLESGDGSLIGVEVARASEHAALIMPCANVVTAGPRGALGTPFSPDLTMDADGYIAADPNTMQTSMFGVWAGGACALGHRSIAHATADGKRAAWQIHAALTAQRVMVTTTSAWVEADGWDAARAPRALATARATPSAGSLPPIDPFGGGGPLPPVDPFSGGTTQPAGDAVREAARCFDCGVLPVVDESCTACAKCVSVCEPGALSLVTGPPRRIELDQDVCTRCGLCVHSCPEGSIAMLRAVWEERLVAEPADNAVSAPATSAPPPSPSPSPDSPTYPTRHRPAIPETDCR